MRICLVTGEYPPMEGGVGAFTRELAHALQDLGHELHIVTTSGTGKGSTTEESGLMVHRQIARWDLRGIRQAGRLLQRLDPAVVNIQYETAAYGMRGWLNTAPRALMHGLAAPLIVTFHDLLPPYLFPKAGPLRRWTVRHLATRADGVISTNAEDETVLMSWAAPGAVPLRRIPIGSNISTELPPDYDRTRYRSAQGWSAGDIVVGFFGFTNRSKGIDTLVRALSALRARGEPAYLLLIGGRTGTSDGTNAPYAEEVDRLIDDLAMTAYVARTGFASEEGISAALCAVDVCALPYRDGANLRRGTLHAALAHGCPIVTTTPVVPIPELQDGVNCIFVPPDDPDALARALTALVCDSALCRRLGAAAEALGQRFTWSRIAEDTVAFYRDLC